MIKLSDWGINSRVILTAIIPVIIFAFVFSAYINNARNQDLVRELNERGNLIATNLAAAAEFPVATRNIEQIRVLVDSTINQKDVIGVRIIDETGKQLFKRGSYGSDDGGDVSQYLADIVSTALEDNGLFNLDGLDNNSESKLLLGTVEIYVSNESYQVRQKTILGKTVAITLAGILLSLIFSVLVGNGLVKPVRDVIDVVSSISHGKLSIRVIKNAGGELGKLQSGINEMAETIATSQMKLEKEVEDATVELKKTVLEFENKNIELDKARHEAMLAKDAKTEFLANMSHEIRTPLNAIIGFSKQLDKSELDEKQKDFSRTINTAARQLLTVIDDILSFSKLESGNLTISKSNFFLRDCLENIVSMISHTANEKDIELVLLVDADVPDIVEGDADRISQVLINLVNNAVKFTDHGSVVIQVSTEGEDTLKVQVTDTGCGISDEAQQKLFSPFYQENQHSSKRHAGTGLGLVISQRLINMMGGELTFKSEVGVGSEFSAMLPLKFVSMHNYVTVDKPVNVHVLDGNTYSRRAIRNNLVHMGFTVYAVNKNDKLIENLQSVLPEQETIVMLSLPPGYSIDSYFQHFHHEIRSLHNGLIILLTSQEQGAAENNNDQGVKIITKPVRLSVLSTQLLPDSTPHSIQHQQGKVETYIGYSALVAEDNEFNQKYVTSLLEGHGFSVTCAATGNKALEECKKQSFDIILMDLHMPELDGLDATQMIRNLDNHQNTPIIAITADVFANDDKKLTDLGFTDCMFKPIDEDKLAGIFTQYLGKRTLKNETLIRDNPDINAIGTIPADMRERLFKDLYLQYDELVIAMDNKYIEDAREIVHKILGLVCYFKIVDMEELAKKLQSLVRSEDFESAQKITQDIVNFTVDVEKKLS